MKKIIGLFILFTSLHILNAKGTFDTETYDVHSTKSKVKADINFLNQLWHKWDDRKNEVSFTDLNTKDWKDASETYQSWRQREVETASSRKDMPPTLYELVQELGFEGKPSFLPTLLKVYFCLDGMNADSGFATIKKSLQLDPVRTLQELDAQFIKMKKTKDTACLSSKEDLDALHILFSATLLSSMGKEIAKVEDKKKRADYRNYRTVTSDSPEILQRMEPIYEVTDKMFGYTPKTKK